MIHRMRPTALLRATALRPIIEALEARALLSFAGSPDATYGTLGLASVQFTSSPPADSTVSSEAIQADGKVVAVGSTLSFSTGTDQAAVERLDGDGSPDPSFGNSGFVLLQDPTAKNESTSGDAVAIQADGKIVIAGHADNTATTVETILLVRLDADGSVDTTFGTAGYVEFRFKVGSTALSSAPTTLAIEPDGKIVVGGKAPVGVELQATAALARFNADGSPDTTFGTAGQVLLIQDVPPMFQGGDGVDGLVIQPDGAIVYSTTIGVPSFPLAPEFVVGRLTPAGSLDSTFGVGGEVPLGGLNDDSSASHNGLTIQADGRLIVVGNEESDSGDLDVYRLDANGSPDPTFGVVGKAIIKRVSGFEQVNDPVLVQPDGKIVVGGAQYTDVGAATLVRLDPDGSPDITFGLGGIDNLPTSITGDSVGGAQSLAIQPDGKLLAANRGGVVRLLATGAANDFDDDGKTDLAVLLTNFAAPIFVYHPSAGPAAGPDASTAYGIPGAGQTLPAPGAYDGGGVDELGVYLPSGGAFAYRTFGRIDSETNLDFIGPKGLGQAIPAPADYTGSGHTEVAVYDVATGSFIYSPEDPANSFAASNPATDVTVRFGIPGAGNTIPVPADYYGTGQDDIAVYLPQYATFAIQDPSGKTIGRSIPFGVAGAGQSIPVPGDYDGSGHVEVAVYLPALGAFAYRPYDGGPDQIIGFGLPGLGNSIPVPGDYDGSGHTELAVYIPAAREFAYRPYDGGPDVFEIFGSPGVGHSIPFTATGAQAFAGGGDEGGSAEPRPAAASWVDFVPDLAGQAKKNEGGSTSLARS